MSLPRLIIFYSAIAFCLAPFMGSAWCLLLGIIFALTGGAPLSATHLKSWTKLGLGLVITCLGAGMDITSVINAGQSSIALTAGTIILTLLVGLGVGRLFKTPAMVSTLISFGTAICGGSAIAALAPALRAKSDDISVALGCVFILNAAALLLFPIIGNALGMSQEQFGLWAALAIHDTSSVVGAGAQFGPQALEIATITKLVRALWIVPFVLILSVLWDRMHPAENDDLQRPARKGLVPWFIYGFLGMSVIFSFAPDIAALPISISEIGHGISYGGKRLMEIVLFLIGASLSRQALANTGIAALAQGVMLWLCVSGASAWAILAFIP